MSAAPSRNIIVTEYSMGKNDARDDIGAWLRHMCDDAMRRSMEARAAGRIGEARCIANRYSAYHYAMLMIDQEIHTSFRIDQELKFLAAKQALEGPPTRASDH